MDQRTRTILIALTVSLTVGVLAWSVWMIYRHLVKKDPSVKCRWYETLVMRPVFFGILGPIIILICGSFTLYELTVKPEQKDIMLLMIIGVVSSVLFVLYGTRWVLIYSDDRLRYRPLFGEMRTYDFGEIRSLTPVAFDLLIRVGRRWIIVDAMQDWHPLWEKYRLWQKKNGIPVRERVYKTAIGRAFGGIVGGWGILAVYTFFLVGGFLLFTFLAWMVLKDGAIRESIVCLLFALLSLVTFILILIAAANWEKYPRFSKKILGNVYDAIKSAQQNRK